MDDAGATSMAQSLAERRALTGHSLKVLHMSMTKGLTDAGREALTKAAAEAGVELGEGVSSDVDDSDDDDGEKEEEEEEEDDGGSVNSHVSSLPRVTGGERRQSIGCKGG